MSYPRKIFPLCPKEISEINVTSSTSVYVIRYIVSGYTFHGLIQVIHLLGVTVVN